MKYLNYLDATWEDFRDEINEENSLILIPVGCLEEHGPHLPINTDCVISEKICENVAKKSYIILGPPVRFGVCRKTQGFPGTLEIRINTLRALIFDIVSSFASQGVKNIVLFTWHGGVSHATILREACIDILEKLRNEKGLPRVMDIKQFESLPHIYLISGLKLLEKTVENEIISILETEPYHAAELETSLMLYLAPDAVKKERIKDLKESPKFPEHRIFMRGNPWLKQGLMGDASNSTFEKGKKLFKIYSNALFSKVQEYLNELS